jgi:hypothetical protein
MQAKSFLIQNNQFLLLLKAVAMKDDYLCIRCRAIDDLPDQ